MKPKKDKGPRGNLYTPNNYPKYSVLIEREKDKWINLQVLQTRKKKKANPKVHYTGD
jgi:hypothetical protein